METLGDIPAFWVSNENFGDALTPYLIKKISGRSARYVAPGRDEHKYIVTGSLLALPQAQYTTMWGPGVAFQSETVRPVPNIIAVRGPISASKVVEGAGYHPMAIGDPGLLLPQFYSPDITKKHKVGIVPSWVDRQKVEKDYPTLPCIDVFDPIEEVIDQILSCESVVCSCLHGLVASVAYGVPTRWVEFSDGVIGDGTKFRDFFASIGHGVSSVDLRSPVCEEDLASLPVAYGVELDLDRLLLCCPFLEEDSDAR